MTFNAVNHVNFLNNNKWPALATLRLSFFFFFFLYCDLNICTIVSDCVAQRMQKYSDVETGRKDEVPVSRLNEIFDLDL